MLTLDKFEEASEKVKEVTTETKLVYSDYFSQQTGAKVFFKPENLQFTGAYKVRGAYYKMSTLTEEERAKGVITASAGNHAQGVAYAAKHANVPATIVMPTTTPLIKVNNTKNYGANVVLHGATFDDAAEEAARRSKEDGLTYIHPFNDLRVATGQGTISYEIFSNLPDVDIILVPIGGGGLASGVSTLAKLLNPNVKVIGVEPTGAASMKASLEAGHIVTLPTVDTIADGVAVKTPGDQVFPYIQENLDDIITINDDELVSAFLDMTETHKMIVENAGLLTVAALYHLDCKNQNVVPILTGGHKHVMNDEEWDRFCKGLNRLGQIASERGFKLCFHHHMGTVCQTVEETTRLMENTDPKYVFLCFDTGHFTFAGEDPVKMLEKFADRVGHVHLKNMRMPLVEKARAEHWSFLDAVRAGAFTVPGDPDGCVEFDKVFDLLDKAGYTGWIMVEAEQDPAKANPFEYAKMGREYITAHTGLGGEVVLKK